MNESIPLLFDEKDQQELASASPKEWLENLGRVSKENVGRVSKETETETQPLLSIEGLPQIDDMKIPWSHVNLRRFLERQAGPGGTTTEVINQYKDLIEGELNSSYLDTLTKATLKANFAELERIQKELS